MSASRDRQIVIELVIQSDHPSLLEGLDSWLQLGLLSDAFVRQLCQEEFTCLVPETAIAASPELPAVVAASARNAAQSQVSATSTRPTRPPREPQPNLLSQALQAFMAEISVVWLLFLGVFLVVVSSGVLAATQWRNISPLGQYGILFGYTLAFWGASLWTRRQASLQLTSQMLAIATLLLIPVNFWMIDGFRLWQRLPELGVIAIAVVALMAATFFLLRQNTSLGMIAAVLLLSGLQWGWQQTGYPLIATYIGTIVAAVVLLFQDARRPRPLSPESLASTTSVASAGSVPPALSSIALAVSALLLISRAFLVAQVAVSQLGLAIGICGWLMVWLARRDRTRLGWSRAGTGLLLLAWLLTVSETPPWQAMVISGLGLWLLLDALWQTEKPAYLVAGFCVGLQGVWLVWLLFPLPWRSQIINGWVEVAGNQSMPFALLALWFFPYLLGVVRLAFYFRQQQRLMLARDTEWLALILGGFLMAISLDNGLVRSLTLTLASVTLIGVAIYRRPRPKLLIYLTHGAALAAFFAWVDYGFPRMGTAQWVGVLVLITAVEWGYSAIQINPAWIEWVKSAWYFGIGLAGISYALLWDTPWGPDATWKLGWMLIPAMLTGLTYRDRFPERRMAGALSVLSLVLVQPLLWDASNTRLAGFGIATLFMLLNTRQIQRFVTAILTIGFGLGFWWLILWETLQEQLTFSLITVSVAFTVLLLWSLHHWLTRRQSQLYGLYRRAVDGWAIAVLLFAFLLLSLNQLLIYVDTQPTEPQTLVSCGLLILATTYRTWQRPDSWCWFAIAFSLELLVASLLLQPGRFPAALAIANLGLGYVALLMGNWWIGRRSNEGSEQREMVSATSTPAFTTPSSWHMIPLLYAALGIGLGHYNFVATTGFYTLAGAGIALGVGRRQPTLQVVTYIGLAGISIAAYELLIYQLLQAKGGAAGDGMVALAALATGLAVAFRGLRRQLARFLHLESEALQAVAHVHWGLGNGFLIVAVLLTLSRSSHWLWTGVLSLLTLYALSLGNQRWSTERSFAQIWTASGIVGLLATIASVLWLLLPTSALIDWAGAIAAVIAIGFHRLPFPWWGWQRLPWRQAAALLPGGVILLTAWGANLQSLLAVAAFYAWFAAVEQEIRLSYVSVLLANWALFRLLDLYNATQPLWYAAIVGSSLLYIAQVEPALQDSPRQEQRHWLRCFATGLICLTAFYQAEVGISGVSPFVAGMLAIGVEFTFILLGLFQRVRAFLYVGTLTFVLQVLWQLWRFVQDYSLTLWILGIVMGLILIWVAATFEARRAQANALLQHWITELEDWQ
jgi:hypothetical protein